MNIRAFRPDDESAVIALWQACGLIRPWNDPRKDIARKLTVQPELFLVGTIDAAVMASVMAGYEGHRGWVNYLAAAVRFVPAPVLAECRGRAQERGLHLRTPWLLFAALWAALAAIGVAAYLVG